MKFAASNEAIKETTRCGHDFSCLTTGKCGNLPKCKVENRFDDYMLYVQTTKDAEDTLCSYKFTCGSGHQHICTCPTYYAIYMQKSLQMR
jgi:hypothetical protein